MIAAAGCLSWSSFLLLSGNMWSIEKSILCYIFIVVLCPTLWEVEDCFRWGQVSYSRVLTLVSTELNRRHNYAFDWFLESIDDSGIIDHKDGPLGTGRQSNPGTWFMSPDDRSLRMPQQWTIFTLELNDMTLTMAKNSKGFECKNEQRHNSFRFLGLEWTATIYHLQLLLLSCFKIWCLMV